MSRAIWWFEIDHSEKTTIAMPIGAIVRMVEKKAKDLKPRIWCEVNYDLPRENRTFEIFGTGQDIPHDARWVYSWIEEGQIFDLVWHLYELR